MPYSTRDGDSRAELNGSTEEPSRAAPRGSRSVAPSLFGFAGAAIMLGAVVVQWLARYSFASDVVVLGEAAAVAILGAVAVVSARSAGGPWTARAPWLVSGALLGSAVIGRPTLLPWLLASILAFAAAGISNAARELTGCVRLAGFAGIAFVLNAALLWALLIGNHGRASPNDFLSLDLRAHALLQDVPLQDVWVLNLHGGGDGRTLQDLRSILNEETTPDGIAIVQGLYLLRRKLGDLFGWDAGACDRTTSSYVHRLTETDRARSLVEPGSCRGSFRTVYDFGDEAITEATNKLVHSFSATALVPTPDGYRLYMAIYAKRIRWVTPVYMTLINPFRRLFIYPDLVNRIERGWMAHWGTGSRASE